MGTWYYSFGTEMITSRVKDGIIPLSSVVASMMVSVRFFVTVNENKYRKEMEDINYGDPIIEEPALGTEENRQIPKDVRKSMILLASIFLGWSMPSQRLSQYVVNF